MVTVCYVWLRWATYGYSGLHMVTVGYIWLLWVTYGYNGLHMVTVGYHMVTVTICKPLYPCVTHYNHM